jgi:anti-sigma factor RsiW
MSSEPCASMEFLLQADVDGQLDIGDAAGLAAHLAQCDACRQRRAALVALSARLRAEIVYHVAPAGLRRSIEAQLGITPKQRAREWWRFAFPVGVGAAFAAVLVFALIPGREDQMSQSVVASHIRALQPGHLMDVVSTDRHTVKPWFDGRLDYAPPVKDFAAQGFPLTGGRLDYLGGRPVAALDYRRGKHDIDFYVWPSAGSISVSPLQGVQNGYNFIRWSQDNMIFWVVSDLNPSELGDFVKLWRNAPS